MVKVYFRLYTKFRHWNFLYNDLGKWNDCYKYKLNTESNQVCDCTTKINCELLQSCSHMHLILLLTFLLLSFFYSSCCNYCYCLGIHQQAILSTTTTATVIIISVISVATVESLTFSSLSNINEDSDDVKTVSIIILSYHCEHYFLQFLLLYDLP